MTRKPWMREATAFKWTSDGLMTTETANAQRASNRRPASISAMRRQSTYCDPVRLNDYLTFIGKSHQWVMTIEEVSDLLYCDAWCKAYGKTVADYFGAAPLAIAAE